MWLLALIPGFGQIASLGFGLLSTIVRCKTCMIVIGVIAVFIAGDIRGRHVEKVKWAAADLAQQVKAAKRDAKIKDDLALFAQAESARLKLENQGLQNQISEIAAREKNRPSVCLMGPEDLKRIEAIK